MYNFLKALFGIPSNDIQEPRNDRIEYKDTDLKPKDNEWYEENDLFGDIESNVNDFGFSIYSDPGEVHKYIHSIFDEMQKKMNLFGFSNHPSTSWEDQKISSFFPNYYEDTYRDSKSLRDSFLKTSDNTSMAKKNDIDLDGKVKAQDLESFFNNKPGTSQDANSILLSPQNTYSKSVFIRTIRHTDGTVETIKKVRDHTGKEETTITRDNIHDPVKPPDFPIESSDDDSAGISIFRRFFPF